MQADLEKVSQQKFNFFHKMKVRPNLTTVDIIGGILIAISVMFGFSHRAEQRDIAQTSQTVENLSGTKIINPAINPNYVEIINQLKEIDFDKNPEKMKKEIWDKFAVSAHFAYMTKDNAELGFTYKGENYTVHINKDKENTYLYVPAKNTR